MFSTYTIKHLSFLQRGWLPDTPSICSWSGQNFAFETLSRGWVSLQQQGLFGSFHHIQFMPHTTSTSRVENFPWILRVHLTLPLGIEPSCCYCYCSAGFASFSSAWCTVWPRCCLSPVPHTFTVHGVKSLDLLRLILQKFCKWICEKLCWWNGHKL